MRHMHRPLGLLATVAAVVMGACAFEPATGNLPLAPDPFTPQVGVGSTVMPVRVWDNPYADVNWTTTRRLLAQTHDHIANTSRSILSYDSAGYQVVPLMDYSGVASLSYAKKRRLWPADSVVSSSVRSAVRNIRTWTPAAEEVGYQHIVSLFLTTYIAKWESTQYPAHQDWMYDNGQGAIDLVNGNGAFPILAHPWGPAFWTGDLRGYRGIEIYSAFAEAKRELGTEAFFRDRDRNLDLLEAWDRSLRSGNLVVGFAVNDHFGPDSRDTLVSRRTKDSGKSIVLATDTSLAAVRSAIESGRVFAVRDVGLPKLAFAQIDSIFYKTGTITVHTAGTVRWVSDGRVVREGGNSFLVADLPPTARYIRAEVISPDGSIVYAQPMRLRPRGDVNGDWRVDSVDAAICTAITVSSPARDRRACESRVRAGIN